MVTHDINSARRGNRIIYIKDGEVVDFCEGELMPEQIEIWLYRNGIELD